jgi:hypothetical protein
VRWCEQTNYENDTRCGEEGRDRRRIIHRSHPLLLYRRRVLFGTDTAPDRAAHQMYSRFLKTHDEYFNASACHHPQGFRVTYGVSCRRACSISLLQDSWSALGPRYLINHSNAQSPGKYTYRLLGVRGPEVCPGSQADPREGSRDKHMPGVDRGPSSGRPK